MTEDELLLAMKGLNGFEYNHLKTVEELAELSEVLMKKVLKMGGPKEPDDQSIIDEIGDVEIRLRILRSIYDSGKIDKRVRDKLSKFEEYYTTQRYTHI